MKVVALLIMTQPTRAQMEEGGLTIGEVKVPRETTLIWTAAFLGTLLVLGITALVLEHLRVRAQGRGGPPSAPMSPVVSASASAPPLEISQGLVCSGERGIFQAQPHGSYTRSLLLEFTVGELRTIMRQNRITGVDRRKPELVDIIMSHPTSLTERQSRYMMGLRERGARLTPPVVIQASDVSSKYAASAWLEYNGAARVRCPITGTP